MLKKVSTFVFSFVAVFCLFCGCKSSKIKESQIKADMEEQLTGLTVDSVKIEKSQRIDNTDKIWIELDFHNNDCEGKRYYILCYSYYDRGGWLYESLENNKLSDWKATPKKGMKLTESEAAQRIFVESENGGYKISTDIYAQFPLWTDGLTTKPSDDFPLPVSYIDSVSCNDDELSDGLCSVTAYASVSSSRLKLSEVYVINYYYDPCLLYWQETSIASESFSVEPKTEFNGAYSNKENLSCTISEFSKENSSFILEQNRDKKKYTIYGLFTACVSYPAEHKIESDCIKFYTTAFESKSTMFYWDTKDTEAAKELRQSEASTTSYGTPKTPTNSDGSVAYKTPYTPGASYPLSTMTGFMLGDKEHTNFMRASEFECIKKLKDSDGRFYLSLTLKDNSIQRFSDITEKYKNQKLYIYVESVIVSTPYVESAINKKEFSLTFDEAVSEADADTLMKIIVDDYYFFNVNEIFSTEKKDLEKSGTSARITKTRIK